MARWPYRRRLLCGIIRKETIASGGIRSGIFAVFSRTEFLRACWLVHKVLAQLPRIGSFFFHPERTIREEWVNSGGRSLHSPGWILPNPGIRRSSCIKCNATVSKGRKKESPNPSPCIRRGRRLQYIILFFFGGRSFYFKSVPLLVIITPSWAPGFTDSQTLKHNSPSSISFYAYISLPQQGDTHTPDLCQGPSTKTGSPQWWVYPRALTGHWHRLLCTSMWTCYLKQRLSEVLGRGAKHPLSTTTAQDITTCHPSIPFFCVGRVRIRVKASFSFRVKNHKRKSVYKYTFHLSKSIDFISIKVKLVYTVYTTHNQPASGWKFL